MQPKCWYGNSHVLNILTVTWSIKSIALKVYMILPSPLLQKPTRNGKARNHTKKLEERLSTWKGGWITDVVKGRIIQERIRSSCQQVSKDHAKIFANLMMQGRVSSALKILTSDLCVGVHKINDDVKNALKQKHPKPSPILENTLCNVPVNEVLLFWQHWWRNGIGSIISNKKCWRPVTTRCNAISSLAIKSQIQGWKQGTQDTDSYFD